jgi:hypothetical protein
MLWVRGFRDHTISRPGFNLFKPLRRHFPACLRRPGAVEAETLRRRNWLETSEAVCLRLVPISICIDAPSLHAP